jgi:hypothetical protein
MFRSRVSLPGPPSSMGGARSDTNGFLPQYAPSNKTKLRIVPSFEASAPGRSYRSWRTITFNLLGRRRLRTVKAALILVPILFFIAIITWEPHIELAFYRRTWVRKEIATVEPLSGCFAPGRVSASYNTTERLHGARHTEVQAGLPLRFDLDCYDFAGTIPMSVEGPVDQLTYHSYWRTDLASFGPRQEWFLKSFFATQNVEGGARLILWSNGDLSSNRVISDWMRRYPRSFEVRAASIPTLAKGTALNASPLLKMTDKRAWVDGDLVRLLVLWAYGGIWVDMDSLLTRDLGPLLEHEFVTQWDCYGAWRGRDCFRFAV